MSHRFFNFVFDNFRDVSNVSSFEKYYKYRAISFLSIISLIQILILNQNWYLLIKHYYPLKRKTKLSLINNFLIFPTIHQIEHDWKLFCKAIFWFLNPMKFNLNKYWNRTNLFSFSFIHTLGKSIWKI